MSVPYRHLRHQLPVIASLGGTAIAALRKTKRAAPAEEIVQTIAPRPRELVRDYVRHVGGDPSAYKHTLPPHLFPQWGFPLAARTLAGLPYPVARVLNGGCRLEMRAPLPADKPLTVRARLLDIDDDGRRAVLRQQVITGTDETPDALIATLYAIVPLAKGAEKKQPVRVPDDARELAYWRIAPDAGAAFAALTGDVNPIHWLAPYARAAGFKNPILHGFATIARAFEGLVRARLAGDPRRLRTLDARLTRPLTLPAQVGLYTRGGDLWVADAPGGPAYLAAAYTTEDPS
jgi:acyl dehydratase